MSNETADRTQARNKALLIALAPPVAILAAIWVMFLINAIFGFDVTTLSRRGVTGREPMKATTALYIALGLTPIAIGYAWHAARVAVGLFDHGVEVTGTVVGVGKIAAHGMVPLRYRYKYRSSQYTGAVDVLKDDATKMRNEGKVRLIVNSRKPSRSDLYENIYPAFGREADSD